MAKSKPKRDEEREQRIRDEIVVDAYGSEERSLSWYYYLKDQLQFPFTATCVAKCETSPLHVKDEVEVIGMPREAVCESDMFVKIRWEKDGLAVPLSQLKPVRPTDDETVEAVADWHYWVRMGYEF